MKITVYADCRKCARLKETTEAVVEELGVDADVTEESDMTKLAEKGVMSPPGLEIDGEIVHNGTTPPADHIESILTDHAES
ncbi:thioredoxin family protein [Halorubrum tebenquichense]|uniref:Redox-active disulfide protein 2 n=1 Tax=Halorubrum tebenquichense DSM 14210 TaxID=1227485 RepID=M0DDI7_9EURY|nr:thioredoxin family protein [Halorubrum tebenquichense]ELZ32878.1 redox-active disulfide protein 2 [Halorubrum tebenquichense DSM 14210]